VEYLREQFITVMPFFLANDTGTSFEPAAYKFRVEDSALSVQLLWCHITQDCTLRVHYIDKH
jgi:hypothetical protein